MPVIVPIDDPADPRIAAYRDVRERDLVGRQGLFLAEGEVVLRTLLTGSRHQAVSLLLAEHRLPQLAGLIAHVGADIPVYAAGQKVLDAIAGFHLHRGMLGLGRRAAEPSGAELLATAPARSRVLALVGIANHDNMGGLFRNAAAFGAHGMLLDAECCDPLYRKAIRVSVGAALRVPFARLSPDEDLATLLASAGFEPLALSPSGDFALRDLKPSARMAAIFGAEGPGLPKTLMARCRTVRIDMAAGFDSLNVATASGIVLNHLASGES